jgi:peroxiredoxin
VLRDLRIVRLNILAELRNPALRILGLIFAIGAGVYGWQQGSSAASTAVILSAWGGRGFALACCLWFATGALRDQDAQLGAVLRSKPIDGARWVLINWATGVGLWGLLAGMFFVGAALGQLAHAGLASLAAHAIGFLRALVTIISVSSLGFCLTRLTRSPLGATVVLLAFLCVIAGLQLIPTFLRPDYSQNLALYLTATAVLLTLTGFLVERYRRGELRKPLGPGLALLICGVAAYGGGSYAYQSSLPPAEGTIPDLVQTQHLEEGKRVPGFEFPDGKGGRVRTSDYAGKIELVYLFAADDLDAAQTLGALNRVAAEYGAQGVQPIGVCLSMDKLDGATLSWTAGLRFPIASDRFTVKTQAPPESPLAIAWDAQVVPMLVVTDRHRRVRTVLKDPAVDFPRLQTIVSERLKEEPQ